jgi:hypothetical protein
MPEKQKDRLRRMIGKTLDLKQDRPEFLTGLLGAYKNGVRRVRSLSRSGYVYVRLSGNDSEVIEALNMGVSLTFNLKVIVKQSETSPGIYVVTGPDPGQYTNFPTSGGNAGIVPHGSTHSFGNGNDPVFIYKKQLVQPLQAHPTNPRSNALRVEGDFYTWKNEIKYFPGGNTTDLTVANPTTSNAARWITVYLDGDNNSLAYVTGTSFALVTPPFSFVPTGIVYYIPEVSPSIGIPLAAVYLVSGSSNFVWDDIQDIRNFLSGGEGTLFGDGVVTRVPFYTGTSTFMTNPSFIFEDGNPKLVVGNTGSISGFSAQFQAVKVNGQAGFSSITYSTGGALNPFFGAGMVRGIPGAELGVSSGTIIFDISANAWKTGTSPNFISPPPMRITANTLQNWNDQIGYGNYWGFVVTPLNSIVRKESFKIYADRVWIDGGDFRTTGTFYVNPIGASNGQALTYSNGLWIPSTISAGTGTIGPHNIISSTHTDTNTGTSIAEGDILVYQTGLWTPVAGVDISDDAADILAVNFILRTGTITAPGSNHRLIYAKSNGIYTKGSDGLEVGPFGTGTGGVGVNYASGVSIADLGNYYTGNEVETALQEIGASIVSIENDIVSLQNSTGTSSSGGHSHGITRLNISSGTQNVLLLDFADYLEFVSFNGFIVDPLGYSLSSGSNYLVLDNPVVLPGIITVNYVVLTA